MLGRELDAAKVAEESAAAGLLGFEYSCSAGTWDGSCDSACKTSSRRCADSGFVSRMSLFCCFVRLDFFK